jgi:hypothetical protein
MLIIAAVLITLAAAGTGLTLAARHGASPARAAPSPAAGVRPRSWPALAPLPVPQVSLARLAWMDLDGAEVPVSRSAGPRHMQDSLAWGFADTPLGALMAAVNIGVRANAWWGPGIFVPTIRGQVTGPGTAALLASCQASYQQASRAQGVPAGQPLGRASVTEEAFRWVTYTPASATVEIVSASPGAQGGTARAVTRIEEAWSGGDWRVIAPPGGDWGNSAAPLISLTGYTSFPPS